MKILIVPGPETDALHGMLRILRRSGPVTLTPAELAEVDGYVIEMEVRKDGATTFSAVKT